MFGARAVLVASLFNKRERERLREREWRAASGEKQAASSERKVSSKFSIKVVLVVVVFNGSFGGSARAVDKFKPFLMRFS